MVSHASIRKVYYYLRHINISIYERFDCPGMKCLDSITKKSFGTHIHEFLNLIEKEFI